LVEDDVRLAEVLAHALRRESHVVTCAHSVTDARAMLDTAQFELALIDIGLPDGSGLALCRSARAKGHELPILLLTARKEVSQKVDGLDAGADDYLAKPFAVAELLARVRALGRRGPRFEESTRAYGPLVLDRGRHEATLNGERLPLTPRELDVVFMLAWREGHVVRRAEILDAIWGEDTDAAAASFEVLLTRIRRKLSTQAVPTSIRTVREVGYAWALKRSSRS